MKAYSYKRYSTPDQAKGLSLSRQESETEALCRRHGWELDLNLSIDISISEISNRLHRSLICSMTFRDARVRRFVMISKKGVVTHFCNQGRAEQLPILEGFDISELLAMEKSEVKSLLLSIA